MRFKIFIILFFSLIVIGCSREGEEKSTTSSSDNNDSLKNESNNSGANGGLDSDTVGSDFFADGIFDDLLESNDTTEDAVGEVTSVVNVPFLRQFGKTSAPFLNAKHTNYLDKCNSMASDDLYLYCAGETLGHLGEASGGGFDVFVMKVSKTDGELVWLKQIGNTSTDGTNYDASGDDVCHSIAVTEDSIFCGGETSGSFGEAHSGELGETDAFILKLSKITGELIWVKQIGNTSTDGTSYDASEDNACKSIAVSESSIYCGGSTRGDFAETNGGLEDAFVLKLVDNGSSATLSWIKHIGSESFEEGSSLSSSSYDYCNSIAVVESHIYCGGHTRSSLGEANGGSYGYDAFVFKLTDGGTSATLNWVKQIGADSVSEESGYDSSDNDYVYTMSVVDGVIFLSGSTDGNLGETNDGLGDVFVMKLTENEEGTSADLNWIKQVGEESVGSSNNARVDDFAKSMAVVGGSIYLGGYTSSDLGETNKRGDAFVMKLTENEDETSADLSWIKQIGYHSELYEGASADYDYCESLVVDMEGIYCAGYTHGNFGEPSGGQEDIFIMKLIESSEGEGDVVVDLEWIQQITETDFNNLSTVVQGAYYSDYCHSIALDDDYIYCGGVTTGDFSESNKGGRDSLVIKMNKADGEIVWATQKGAPPTEFSSYFNIEDDECISITIDENFVYCGGYTEGNLGEDNSGGDDAFIMKLAKDSGELIWIKQIGSVSEREEDAAEEDDRCLSVAVDGDYVYCGGYTEGSLGENNSSREDAFVMKLQKSDGELVWLKQIGDDSELTDESAGGEDYCRSIAVDGASIYCGGQTDGKLGGENVGEKDAFIFKLTDHESYSTLDWVYQAGTNLELGEGSNQYDDICLSIFAGEGFIYCGGYTSGSLGETNGDDSEPNSSGYDDDAFVMKIKDNGSTASLNWIKQIGQETTSTTDYDSSGNDQCVSLSVSGSSIFCSGFTEGSLGDTQVASEGNNDAFVFKLTDSGNSASLDWIKQIGESYTEGTSYNSSGDDYCLSVAVEEESIFCGGLSSGNLGEQNRGEADIFIWKFLDE